MQRIIEDIKEFLNEAKNKSEKTIRLMDEIKEWNQPSDIVSNAKSFYELVKFIVEGVETVACSIVEELSEEDKRRAAAKIIDDWLDLGYPWEWMDGPVIRFAIYLAVQEMKEHCDD